MRFENKLAVLLVGFFLSIVFMMSTPIKVFAEVTPTPVRGNEGGECCPVGYVAKPLSQSANYLCFSINNPNDTGITPLCNDKGLVCKNEAGKIMCVKPAAPITPNVNNSPYNPCLGLKGSTEMACKQCTEDQNNPGTWTALGCIYNSKVGLVEWILKTGSGIAGGIAFLLLLSGAAQIILSNGVPEKVAAGKEIITSAITGLVFIFLAIFILKLIGVQILGIPGWN